MYIVYLTVFVLISLSSGQDTPISPCPANKDGCQSPNYPNNYGKGTCYCQHEVDPGYQLELVVEHLDLNGATKDSLTIKSGPNDEKKIILIRSLKEKKSFVLPGSTYVLFYSDSSDQNTGFKVRWQRHGEITTTTEPPTTEIDWPKPTANDSIYYTIYLANTTAKEFSKNQIDFRNFMGNITEEYCTEYKIPVVKNISMDNVIIDLAVQCSVLWPDNERCVEVRYAIPIFTDQDSIWKGYQLNSTHLEKMWLNIGRKELKNFFEYTIYEEPDNNYYIIIWLSISLVVVVLFFIMLFGFRTFGLKYGDIKRRRSDTEQIVSPSKRVSDASLWPISEQVVPPLFDNGHNIYYEPDMNTTNVSAMQNSAAKMMNIDDMSDEDIIDVTNVSPNSGFTKNYITLSDDITSKESAL